MVSIDRDEEDKWRHKKFLRGEFNKITHGKVSDAGEIADRFVLSKDGILYYLGRRRGSRESFDDYLENCD